MRAELGKAHDRITGLTERVANLEAQRPHIDASLARIERSVERLNGHIVKAIWIIIALFITAVWRVISAGSGIPGV